MWAFEESLPIAVHGMWPLADPVRNMIYVVGGGIKGGLSMSGTFHVMVSDDDVDAALESTTSTTSASITTQASGLLYLLWQISKVLLPQVHHNPLICIEITSVTWVLVTLDLGYLHSLP